MLKTTQQPLPIEALRSLASRLEIVADELQPLSVDTDTDTLHMTMTPARAEAAARLAKSKGWTHPLQVKLSKRRQSLTDAARLLDVRLPVVKGWTRQKDPRPVRLAQALKAEEIWGLPATAASWPNGITPDKEPQQ